MDQSSDSNSSINTSTDKAIITSNIQQTFSMDTVPSFQTEEDVNDYLETAVSIPYLQMIDSMGNLASNFQSSSTTVPAKKIGDFEFFSKTTEKWSSLKHKVNPSLKDDFESVLLQMATLCPKLGIHIKGSQDDINDAMVLDSLIGPYSITLLCKNISDSFDWMFTGVYAPCASNTEEVKLFWREIEEVRYFWSYPWVIGGDFNEIRFTHERSSGGQTWTNNQTHSIRSRIDRILISPDWEVVHPQVLQQALARPCSDHNPIALNFQGLKHGPPPFRCEYFWFSHPNFLNFAKDMWLSFSVTGSGGYIFCKKLPLLKIKLKEWSKAEYGEVERRLEELEDIFVNLDATEDANNGLIEDQWEKRAQAKQEYCKLTFINAEKMRSRARVTHIKDFENNTKKFHRLANDRRRRSFVGSIKVDGVLTNDEAEIKEGIVSYFQNIFQTQSQRNVFMEGMSFNKITEEMNAVLQRDFEEEEECLAAIKMLGKLKAPGPDGFPVKFYLLCWDFIKEDFLNIMSEFQNKDFLDWRLKNTFIALIPKKDTI
ncbi:uncharacterized protein LOC113359467 [Papaver somniferum]|uniref:uncharacterized protein LOC113359467 n=1 Tax=Papaver somniferum TaxID=3469 RepID=UPI000E704442|nr:uncharacterized protein LOC113359467 [Papaver somniferum]